MVQIRQEHLNFILRIYETTTNPENWASVLGEFATYCGAEESQLVLGDTLNPELL